MSSVTMLKHDIIYKKCLVIINNSCLRRLKLSAQVNAEVTFFVSPIGGQH